MRIRWTESAVADFTHISDYSDTNFGLVRGRRTALRIYEAVDLLADFPNIGRVGRKHGTSELVINGLPFIIIYRLKDGFVELLRILHGSQEWP